MRKEREKFEIPLKKSTKGSTIISPFFPSSSTGISPQKKESSKKRKNIISNEASREERRRSFRGRGEGKSPTYRGIMQRYRGER